MNSNNNQYQHKIQRSQNNNNNNNNNHQISLYKYDDTLMFDEKLNDILSQADELRLVSVEPTRDKIWQMIFIVRDFVIEKKRKIYGGFALNKLIEEVAPQDKFYDDGNIESWDIDFYSPDPIGDANEIADRLSAKGFKYVRAVEALHDETYKIFADTIDCADISYVPSNIYHKMPFKIVNNLCLTGPHFMMIDYFRMLTDPLTSYHRIEKSFKRLYLLQKYFPLPNIKSSIEMSPPDSDLDIALNHITDFLTNRESIITVGMYQYNHLIRESKINLRLKSNNNTKINFVDINYYEVISIDYKKDSRDLINLLKDKFKYGTGSTNKITYEENYPFFQYLGYSVNIMINNEIICKMYHYNNRCTPYFDVDALYFTKGNYNVKSKGKIRIGTFACLMMYSLINIMKARADEDEQTKNLYYTIISHITEMKNYYFDREKKTIFDKSLFQEFIVKCIGDMVTPKMEQQIRIDRKREKGQRYSYSYDPKKDKKSEIKYIFKNSSGNRINNAKNQKIDLINKYASSELEIDEDYVDDSDSIDNNQL